MIEILTPTQRMQAFARLGRLMLAPDEQLNALIHTARQYNAWFTPQETLRAVQGIAAMLNEADLQQWFGKYTTALNNHREAKTIGLVLAGNIPLVGFHDILCVLAAGHKAMIKLSSHDDRLIPYLFDQLAKLEPAFAGKVTFTERLQQFDAVIATGSNNTSRYFEYYFGKVPHIIRKNRNSVAVLSGKESAEELEALGHDIFDYFGLGCRNVSKLFVPAGYSFNHFFAGIEKFSYAGDHHKFNNNYDYSKSIYLVNGNPHLDNGFLLLKPDERIVSPLAVLYYEEYTTPDELTASLNGLEEQLQCVVSTLPLAISTQQVGFGKSQQPRLWDYADGVDTMAFLTGI